VELELPDLLAARPYRIRHDDNQPAQAAAGRPAGKPVWSSHPAKNQIVADVRTRVNIIDPTLVIPARHLKEQVR
jgi:hypothetical protein